MNSNQRLSHLLCLEETSYYTKTLDVLPYMVIIKDNNDSIVWVNLEVLNKTGETCDRRLNGKKTHSILDFMPKDKYTKLDEEILITGESILNTTDKLSTSKHKDMVVRVDKLPFIDPDTNKCIGVVTYIIDISDNIAEYLQKYIHEVEFANLRTITKKIITNCLYN